MNIPSILGLPDVLSVKKVIAVQPHPDDNEVNIAGTLLQLHRNGCEIVFVTVTDGRAGAWGNVQDTDKIVKVREAERLEAGKLLGVQKHITLDFPDGGDYTVAEVTAQLVAIFREEKPDLVFSVDPWMPYEAHPDHVKVGQAVSQAVLFANNAILHPVVGAAPFQVPQIAFYATSYPNRFVEFTEEDFHLKLNAILTHRSQFDNDMWTFIQQYFAIAAKEAYQVVHKSDSVPSEGYAEPLKVLAHLQLHSLPNTLYS